MASNESRTNKQEKEDRDLRVRKQYFPEAENLIFNTGKAGFVPMPILMRKAMRHLRPPELRVLVYLQTRCSRYFICYPTLEEIAHDLDLAGRRNLTPHLKILEKKKFISTATGAGKKYFLVHDPRVAINHLVETGEIGEDELFEINELLSDLNQDPITTKLKSPTPKLVPAPIRKAKSG
jgi:DNA-binding MarR family transcriptional regulator